MFFSRPDNGNNVNNRMLFLAAGSYFIRTFYSNINSPGSNYEINLFASPLSVAVGTMELTLIRNNGSILDFNLPVYSTDSKKSMGEIFTTFEYDRYGVFSSTFPFRFNLGKKSEFCKKVKNKNRAACKSEPLFTSFKTNHFKSSVIPIFSALDVSKKEITADIRFDYESSGSTKATTLNPVNGDLVTGRFVIRFN